MTFDSNTKHYILQDIDLENNLGYSLILNGAVISGGNATKKANYFLKTLSNQVYGIIEARQNGEYLKEKFNEDQDFVEDILLQQFIFWEDSDVDILQSHIKGIAPAVERQLRDRGLLFEGVIRHYES